MFIAIYGINNIGKTYHAKRLVARLRALNRKAAFVKYPIYNQKPTGPFLNKILRTRDRQHISEEELQLWFVLNRYQFQPKLQAKLRSGITVVAEDYIGTGIAWGSAKGASQIALENMNKFLVQPDVAILLTGERKKEAIEKKHLHERNEALAARCQTIYRKLAKKYGWREVTVVSDRDITAARIRSVIAKWRSDLRASSQ